MNLVEKVRHLLEEIRNHYRKSKDDDKQIQFIPEKADPTVPQ